MNEITAILGFLSALVGLLAAYIGRKKKIEYIVKLDNSGRTIQRNKQAGFKKKWYDYYLVIAICMVVFFPIGFYAIYQSRTVSTFWKWFWFLALAFLLALGMSK